ncbi:MAG: heme-dependent oxidative N-demethylase subunit alpha family protein [Armatimonadota bacterium]
MHPLPPVPWYTPFRNGRYRTSPDLFPLGTDLGGGELDHRWLQFDQAAPLRIDAKRAVATRRSLDLATDAFTKPIAGAVLEHLLRCLDADRRALPIRAQGNDPRAELLRVCGGIPEDVAVTVRDADGCDRLAWLHVAFPSRWAPEEKIGDTFAGTHAPVPGMARTSEVAPRLFDTVRAQGPQVRFAWGIAFDPHPDQHPDRPRSGFDGERFWIRVERQVLAALPVDGVFVFTIRVHVQSSERLRDDPGAARGLAAALRGMSPEARAYKGLVDTADALATVSDALAEPS